MMHYGFCRKHADQTGEGGCPECAMDHQQAEILDLRAKLQAAEETGAEATRIIVAAVSDQMSALNLVSRIREAIGDNGRRMQDELIGYCAQLYRSNKAIEEERDGFWRSRAEAAESERNAAIFMLAEWCVCVELNGSGWDDWDECYKDAAYRPGPLRELLDTEIAKQKASPEWGR